MLFGALRDIACTAVRIVPMVYGRCRVWFIWRSDFHSLDRRPAIFIEKWNTLAVLAWLQDFVQP